MAMIVGLMPYHPDHHSSVLSRDINYNFPFRRYGIHEVGPPAETLNSYLSYTGNYPHGPSNIKTLIENFILKADWIVTIDPHLIFFNNFPNIAKRIVKESEEDIAVVHLSVEMRGPGGTWRRFLREIPEAARFQRLCSMWRVNPLREIGGFTDVEGRNHVPATTIKLIDAGYQYGIHAEPIAVHEDPDLTLETWLMNMYKSGKAWTQLQLRHRGHPYMDAKTRYPMTFAQRLTDIQVAKLFWKAVACIRILGACEALGHVPQLPIPPGKVEVTLE
jgi:hypothetical protein